jgi:hypothetical protein
MAHKASRNAKLRRAALKRLIGRAIKRACLRLPAGQKGGPTKIEKLVRLVERGYFDTIIEAHLPHTGAAFNRRRFETQEEFSYAVWKARRTE